MYRHLRRYQSLYDLTRRPAGTHRLRTLAEHANNLVVTCVAHLQAMRLLLVHRQCRYQYGLYSGGMSRESTRNQMPSRFWCINVIVQEGYQLLLPLPMKGPATHADAYRQCFHREKSSDTQLEESLPSNNDMGNHVRVCVVAHIWLMC